MSMTLQELLENPRLRLKRVVEGNPSNLERSIVWVHITEVTDSMDFCEPGEIILTIGLNLPRDENEEGKDMSPASARIVPAGKGYVDDGADPYDTYVGRMVDAGVIACGFGTGMHHPVIPARLVRAAQVHGLALFEVPWETTFQDINRAVSQSIADDGQRRILDAYGSQRRFLTAAQDADPIHSVLLSLAHDAHGWAAFLLPDGSINDISHITAQSLAQRAVAAFLSLNQPMNTATDNANSTPSGQPALANSTVDTSHMAQRTSGRTASSRILTSDDGRFRCCIRTLRDADQRMRAMLLVASPIDEADDMALNTLALNATDVLSIALRSDIEEQNTVETMRNLAMRDLAKGKREQVNDFVPVLWPAPPRQPLIVLCIQADGDRDASHGLSTAQAMQMSRALIQSSSLAALWGRFAGLHWIVCSSSDGGAIREALQQSTGSNLHPMQWRYGQSQSVTWDELPEAFSQAQLDLKIRASWLGTSGAQHASDIASLTVNSLVSRSVSEAFCHAFLGPLLASDHAASRTRSTLLRTAVAYVTSSFNVNATAKRMGVHRHTIENRIARLERLLGISTANAEDLARLCFAVKEYTTEQARTTAQWNATDTRQR